MTIGTAASHLIIASYHLSLNVQVPAGRFGVSDKVCVCSINNEFDGQPSGDEYYVHLAELMSQSKGMLRLSDLDLDEHVAEQARREDSYDHYGPHDSFEVDYSDYYYGPSEPLNKKPRIKLNVAHYRFSDDDCQALPAFRGYFVVERCELANQGSWLFQSIAQNQGPIFRS